MKRKDLIRTINDLARSRGLACEWRQGGRHTVVRVGDAQASIPRHREINEITARSIIAYIERETR
ncbi:hypothetical protein [Bifidobacterium avesanii]|uniref:Addiction module toxin, HicA family n=1 Tax=Bifidobacterium avesanii TaxID=1798157 RepID=A0A7K3TEU4_9BIFI|nr:hypothetical protein [Bifidobacterium avesanii]KAB8295611.1 toxin-antitoxin system toxin component HicA family [Bifidobacterium avesanii]NEG77615.1 hypothetical protein [Bifidobacterium avesanii]